MILKVMTGRDNTEFMRGARTMAWLLDAERRMEAARRVRACVWCGLVTVLCVLVAWAAWMLAPLAAGAVLEEGARVDNEQAALEAWYEEAALYEHEWYIHNSLRPTEEGEAE